MKVMKNVFISVTVLALVLSVCVPAWAVTGALEFGIVSHTDEYSFATAADFDNTLWGSFAYNSENQNIEYSNGAVSSHATQQFEGLGTFSDFEIEYTLFCLTNGGFVFRRAGNKTSGDDGYCLFFTDNSVNLRYLTYQGKLKSNNLESGSVSYPYGKPVKIKAEGSSIKVWLKDGENWNILIDYTDSTFSTGYFGYKTYYKNEKATLDDIKITKPSQSKDWSFNGSYAMSNVRTMGDSKVLTNDNGGSYMFDALGKVKDFVYETDFYSADVSGHGIRFRDDKNGNFYLLQFYGTGFRVLKFANNTNAGELSAAFVKPVAGKKYRVIIEAIGTNIGVYIADYDANNIRGDLTKIISVTDDTYNREGYFGSRIQSATANATFSATRLTVFSDCGTRFTQNDDEINRAISGNVKTEYGVTAEAVGIKYALISAVYDSDNTLVDCSYIIKTAESVGVINDNCTMSVASGQKIKAFIWVEDSAGINMIQPLVNTSLVNCQ